MERALRMSTARVRELSLVVIILVSFGFGVGAAHAAPPVVKTLREALNDSVLTVKRKVIWALGEVGGEQDVSLLENLEGNPMIVKVAQSAVSRIQRRLGK